MRSSSSSPTFRLHPYIVVLFCFRIPSSKLHPPNPSTINCFWTDVQITIATGTMTGSSMELSSVRPRVLIVSRRAVRKSKFVDFVGEYHLDLIVKYGAAPAIVPRISGLELMIESLEPIHGVLLCEGEDVDPALYDTDLSSLTPDEIEEIQKMHSSDTWIDRDKDSIEFQLARRCVERNIPFLGISRGAQVLNVVCGGTLYQDVEKELSKKGGIIVQHKNYANYDQHRHSISIKKGTPLHHWFAESLRYPSLQLNVNSYHHQGVKRLANKFRPMAVAPDGLIEAFYDPNTYNPVEGKFLVGLQFHPERMRNEESIRELGIDSNHERAFDYPGCTRPHEEFVKSVIMYHKKLMLFGKEREFSKVNGMTREMQKKILCNPPITKGIYVDHVDIHKGKRVHEERGSFNAFIDPQKDGINVQLGLDLLESHLICTPQYQKRTKGPMEVGIRDSMLESFEKESIGMNGASLLVT